ncbi:MAG TPA: M23 family metallopeptidase [Myxococcaceae bacterium]|nr:M23 family metallopeptidase [Myxococcaceae bacterium]
MARHVPLPTLGPTRKQGSSLARVLFFLIFVGLVLGGWWWRKRHPVFIAAPVATHIPPAAAPPVAMPDTAPPVPPDPLKQAGLRRVSVALDGALETSLVSTLGPELGQALAQVISRTLVWWVSMPGGLRRGDRIAVLFQERRNEEPLLHAVKFASVKLGQTFQAYRFKPEGASFARSYLSSGEELELRLKDAPLDDYEQVTSLIRDGRKHKGVDFKTPVGSRVKATFDGMITRKNWNFRGNGNSLEVSETGGQHRRALFLHLSELPKTQHVGDPVARGQVIASSGNSGHSFAPHLHYQLMQGDTRLLDPFESHETYRRALSAEHKPAFETEMHRLDGLLSSSATAPAQLGSLSDKPRR